MSMQLAVAAPAERTGARPVFVAAGIAAILTTCLNFLPTAGSTVHPAHGGNWLAEMVIHITHMLPSAWPPETVLTVIATAFMSLLIAWLYERLLYNDWTPLGALALVAALACNSALAVVVASDQWAIATMVACILLIPGVRRIESVGDVQANMSFGLVLPFLFLAGPEMAPLIPLLALFGALSDRDARRDIRAFIAMYLVAIMPTLLVLAGMVGMIGLDETARIFAEFYVPAFTPSQQDVEVVGRLVTVAAYTVLPFAILTGAYVLAIDRRWQPVSAVVVLALPLYLILGARYFGWQMAAYLPLVAFLGGFAAWLAVSRLWPNYRRIAIALLILSAAASWSPKILPLLVG